MLWSLNISDFFSFAFNFSRENRTFKTIDTERWVPDAMEQPCIISVISLTVVQENVISLWHWLHIKKKCSVLKSHTSFPCIAFLYVLCRAVPCCFALCALCTSVLQLLPIVLDTIRAPHLTLFTEVTYIHIYAPPAWVRCTDLSAMLCFAMLWYAMLCYAMLVVFWTLLCCAVYVVLCCAVLLLLIWI